MQYHYHLQGYIYNLLKGSRYEYVHDKGGYKFFCFSNIFPAFDLKKDDSRTLIISSPDSDFIQSLSENLNRQSDVEVRIGSMKFRVDYNKKLSPEIPASSKFVLLTGTPIILRIPKEKYAKYGLDLDKKYNYVYWRKEHPISLFVSQLQSNLLRKYREYHNIKGIVKKPSDGRQLEDEEEDSLGSTKIMPSKSCFFQEFKFKKQVSTRIVMKGQEQTVIGTVWEFSFEPNYDHALIKFALECGLGERNSLGFGFMNLFAN
jgi:CRISPR-associated endoribonuclease Cas6